MDSAYDKEQYQLGSEAAESWVRLGGSLWADASTERDEAWANGWSDRLANERRRHLGK